MKRSLSILFLLIFLGVGTAFAQEKTDSYDQFIGEVVSYDVRSLAVKQADANLEFKGLVEVGGRKAYLITFEAKGFNFLDIEKIYADKETFYPLRVERDLNIWGVAEKITEVYDQQNFIVTVTKTTKANSSPQVLAIQKKEEIDNIYCFIYRYRLNGDFKIGSSLKMNLPTKDVSIKIVKKTALEVGEKMLDTIFLETTPAQYKIWFDVGSEKIPHRIDKTAMVGATSMIISNYSKGNSNGDAK